MINRKYGFEIASMIWSKNLYPRGELLFSKYWWATHLQFEFWQRGYNSTWLLTMSLKVMIGVVLCSGLGHGRRWVIILLGPVHNFLLDPVSNFTCPVHNFLHARAPLKTSRLLEDVDIAVFLSSVWHSHIVGPHMMFRPLSVNTAFNCGTRMYVLVRGVKASRTPQPPAHRATTLKHRTTTRNGLPLGQQTTSNKQQSNTTVSWFTF